MQRKISCVFAHEEMEAIKFLVASLRAVDLDQPKDRRAKFFLQEMSDQGWTSDDEVRGAMLHRMQDTADSIYTRVFCA